MFSHILTSFVYAACVVVAVAAPAKIASRACATDDAQCCLLVTMVSPQVAQALSGAAGNTTLSTPMVGINCEANPTGEACPATQPTAACCASEVTVPAGIPSLGGLPSLIPGSVVAVNCT